MVVRWQRALRGGLLPVGSWVGRTRGRASRLPVLSTQLSGSHDDHHSRGCRRGYPRDLRRSYERAGKPSIGRANGRDRHHERDDPPGPSPGAFHLGRRTRGPYCWLLNGDATDACVFAAFIRPEWVGQGIGRRLMERAEAFLFKRHSSIWLHTDGSSRAAGFYERLGWKRMPDVENRDARFEKHRPQTSG
jgi:GNAT superfamily N-acetyltransferase